MPRVPVYESKVNTKPIDAPMVRAKPSALGEIGDGISKIGSVIGSVSDDMAREAEKARTTQALMGMTEFEREVTGALYADHEDPKQRGFMLKNGVSAFENGTDIAVGERLRSAAKRIIESTPDEIARARLADDINKRMVFLDRDIEKHSGAQREVAEKVALSSLEDIVVGNASGGDEDEASVVSMLDKKARLSRDPMEVVAYEKELRGRMTGKVLADMMGREDIDGAEAYLTKNERFIPKKAADDARAKIEDRRLDRNAYALASTVVSMSVDDDGKPNLDMMVVPDDVENLEVRNRSEKMLSQMRSLESKRWEGEKDSKFNDALGAYLRDKRGGLAAAGGDGRRAWMQKHDSEAWLRIERIIQADADRWRSLRERGGSGPSESEQNAMLELQVDMARNPKKYRDPEYTTARFSKEWAHRIGTDNLEQAGGKWASEIRRKEESDVMSGSELMREVDAEVERRGLEGKKATAKSKELARKARARVAAGIAAGNPQDIADIRKWLSDETVEVGLIWDTKRYATDKPGSARVGLERPSDRLAPTTAAPEPPPGKYVSPNEGLLEEALAPKPMVLKNDARAKNVTNRNDGDVLPAGTRFVVNADGSKTVIE